MTQTLMSARRVQSSAVEESPMRVLHFAPRECWPLDTGAKLRNYHLAREVAKSARITLLTFSEAGELAANDASTRSGEPATDSLSKGSIEPRQTEASSEPALPEPERFYERVIRVRRGKGYTPGKIIRGALGATPLPVLNYTTSEMSRELAQVLDAEDFDLVQVESIHLAAYLPIIRAARSRPIIICDWHNIESELMWRYSEHAPGALRRIYARRTSRQLDALERRAMRQFDAHVVVSPEERRKLLAHAPDARVFLIENGVDTEYYADARVERAHNDWLARRNSSEARPDRLPASPSGGAQARRVIFVGSMDYHANVDAVTHFAREVWPRVRRQHPDLTFTIVGRDPSPEVKQLSDTPGVEVTGTVDDVRPYYYDALMAVIPLRVGGGSRLKILEAMAAGVPVVSTRLGAEGIEVTDDLNISLADTSEEMQAAIGLLLADEEKRRKLSAGGRALVFAQYDWSRLGALLVETYSELMNGRR